jgi:hypothetical protein
MRQLRRVMEEKKLFGEALTLQELPNKMSISAHNLSEVITRKREELLTSSTVIGWKR